MNLILEVGILYAFSLGNTPFNKKDFQTPYLLIEKYITDDIYFKSYNTSRTQAVKLNTMNPKTALWDIAIGYKYEYENNIFKIEIGHQSEHEVGSADKLTESFDYIKASYRVEY